MARPFSILAAVAAIAALAYSAAPADAQVPVSCGGAIQKCPEGKTMYCNRWRPCKSKKSKVGKYCDAPICITNKKKEP